MNKLTRNELKTVLKQVLSLAPSYELNGGGYVEESLCPMCYKATFEYIDDIDELPHESDCGYIIVRNRLEKKQ